MTDTTEPEIELDDSQIAPNTLQIMSAQIERLTKVAEKAQEDRRTLRYENAYLRERLKQDQQKDGIIAQMKSDLEGMRYARDEWKRKAEAAEAQAKGKITDEWRRRVAAGEEGGV